DNAVKFTEQGRVSLSVGAVRAARGRYRLTFAVTDGGIGLSKSEIARLFRPFSQANPDTARRFGGAGLGLSFARRIARALGGDLMVKSRAGQGSTFTLTGTLADASASAPTSRATAETRRAAGTRSLHLLCAE